MTHDTPDQKAIVVSHNDTNTIRVFIGKRGFLNCNEDVDLDEVDRRGNPNPVHYSEGSKEAKC